MQLYFALLITFVLSFSVLCEYTVSTTSLFSITPTSLSYTEVSKTNKFDQNAEVDEEESEDEETDLNEEKVEECSRLKRNEREPKVWDRWSKWSKCSVTCGNGKQTRWRHCVGGACIPGEKEAQIKTCVMHPC